MKILITGSSGMIGTKLVEDLMGSEHEIRGIDQRKNPWNDQINEITTIVDLRNTNATLDQLPKDIDAVIHLAANARVFNLIEAPILAKENIETLFSILEFCRLNKVGKFIFASSREVYGDGHMDACTEDTADISNAANPYTASKIGGEAFVHAYASTFGTPFTILRLANVYGMYDTSDRVIPTFIKKCRLNEPIQIFGDGKVLDFTHIEDISSGILSALDQFDSVNTETLNLSCGVGTSLREVAELIKHELHSDSQINILPNRTGEVMKSVVSIKKAQDLINFSPNLQITDGLRKTISWYTRNVY